MPAAAPVAQEPSGRLAASPVVKWAGGKGQLLGQLEPFFPPSGAYNRYFEPFLGGGAVFFHLQPPRAVLSDLNEELINVYEIIRDQLDELLASLRKHKTDEAYYYWVRELPLNRKLTNVQRASRFIYLNKWCYNGLYRVNSKGQFNVPRGRYKTPPRIFDEQNLHNVSSLLNGAALSVAPYELAIAKAGRGDFVYLDPPYQPLSATANFTRYTKDSFDEEDQIRLAQSLDDLDHRGGRFLLNNHDTPLQRRLYSRFNLDVATANRMINSRGDRRRGTTELIVTNYDAW
ncbi:MAG: DNA adenine methylase [Chloroflexi bacterium]|nr:DNA adenine methylase [Chloroflexota bacterium]